MLKLLNRVGHKETREDLKDAVVALHKELAEVYEQERGRDAAYAQRLQRAEAENRELREQIAGLQMRASICADDRDRLRLRLNGILANPKPEYDHLPMKVAERSVEAWSKSSGGHKDTSQIVVEHPAVDYLDEDQADGANNKEEEKDEQIRSSLLTVVYDLDGLAVLEGCAAESLTSMLELSGTLIVGITDGTLEGPARAFWDSMPLNARISKRCLLFCETGMVLYHSNEIGEPITDASYGPFPGNTKRYLQPAIVNALVDEARIGLKEWFKDLQTTPILLGDASHFLHGIASRWSIEDAPLTNDSNQTPRIELRGEGSSLSVDTESEQSYGCTIFGVPAGLGDKYFTRRLAANPELRARVQGQPVPAVQPAAKGDKQKAPLSLSYMASVHGLSKV